MIADQTNTGMAASQSEWIEPKLLTIYVLDHQGKRVNTTEIPVINDGTYGKVHDIGVAYAIWAGVGIVGTMLLGIFVFGESLSFAKTLFIGLILIGALGLNLSFRHS